MTTEINQPGIPNPRGHLPAKCGTTTTPRKTKKNSLTPRKNRYKPLFEYFE